MLVGAEEPNRNILARRAIELFSEVVSATECSVLWWLLGFTVTVNRACAFASDAELLFRKIGE